MFVSRTALVALCASALLACAADPDKTRGSGSNAGESGGTAGAGAGISNTGGSGGNQGGTAGAAGGFAADGGVIEPVSLDQCTTANPAGLSDDDVKKLVAGAAPGDLGYLYPYEGTILPRGLIAPLLMWGGSDDAEAVYVHVKSKNFEFKGCLKPTAAGQLQMPADVWSMAEARTEGAKDPFTIELSTLGAGAVKGPITRKIIIAQATLKGSIFYNSYASSLSPLAGSVLRVQPGKDVDVFIKGDSSNNTCNGCHSMSANGSRLVTLRIGGSATDVYKLDPTTMPQPAALHSNPAAGFVGLSPSGDVYLSTYTTSTLGPRASGGDAAILYETDTGAEIAETGIPTGAMMPTFSSDGSLLTFNDSAKDTAHTLSVMSFNVKTRKAADERTIYTSKDEKRLPGWPFVLPDNKAVVFAIGETTDFSGGNVGIDPISGIDFFGGGFFGGGGGGMMMSNAPTVGPWSNVYLLDLDGDKPVLLAKAMGFDNEADAGDKTKSYLPFKDDELNMNYYPTLSPVAAGGYFWVFFDSERHYGNKGLHRQLWGTAVTISADGSYEADPSHPAFYLTGQEFGTGNHRAFTALDPCKAEGDTCETGIDCCGGFCYAPADGEKNEFGMTLGTCKKPDKVRCANTDEMCKTDKDCCNPDDACIAGFCGQVIPE